jgi:crossover junction endodeoxyribonuclease RuvC
MPVLGLDPGYGRLGFGVVEQKGSSLQAVDYGVIETPAKMPFEERLLMVFEGVEALARKHRCEEAALETLFFSKNVKTAMSVAEARGVIRLALARLKIPVLELQPGSVKLALTGSGSADKAQVTRMVTRLLGLPSPPKPDDAADALALALSALRSRPLRKLTALAKAAKARGKA